MSSAQDYVSFTSKRENPTYLNNLVNKFVKVQLIKNTSFAGFIYSIDPISQSVILSTPKDDTFETKILPGHAVLDITEIPNDGIHAPQKSVVVNDNQEIIKRKSKLIAWFKHNLLPVTECEDKIIVQTLSILRPFTSIDIYAENPVIALQIKKLMEEVPNDFS